MLLDEISEMPAALQAKLLRVLQERQVERLGSNKMIELDVRIIATSNRDLREEVEAGRFREDLYYRLNVMPVYVPPLRQRTADIVPMAQAMLERFAARNGQPAMDFSASAESALLQHTWPGNVRELDNVVQRAMVLAGNAEIDLPHLVIESGQSLSAALDCQSDVDPESLGGDLKDLNAA